MFFCFDDNESYFYLINDDFFIEIIAVPTVKTHFRHFWQFKRKMALLLKNHWIGVIFINLLNINSHISKKIQHLIQIKFYCQVQCLFNVRLEISAFGSSSFRFEIYFSATTFYRLWINFVLSLQRFIYRLVHWVYQFCCFFREKWI